MALPDTGRKVADSPGGTQPGGAVEVFGWTPALESLEAASTLDTISLPATDLCLLAIRFAFASSAVED